MSRVFPKRDDGVADMEDDDHIDLSPDDQSVSGDNPEVAKDDQEHLAQFLEKERHNAQDTTPRGNGAVGNRYRQLLRDHDETSESGSVDGLPRRAGSPIDSLLSIPDDSPSVQVYESHGQPEL